MSNKMQKGFTLVELAIVLVIIGLIVSSVLVGQDLIKAAQLRATVRQYNEFQTGVNTFIVKYNGVPGDLLASQATAFGLTGSGTGADGDGVITDTETGSGAVGKYKGEIANFWSELTTPGKELISGSFRGTDCTACTAGLDFPPMKFGAAGWGVYGLSGINYFVAGVASPSTTTATTLALAFIPVDAYNIDNKIDDGQPNTGNVTAGGASLTTFVAAVPTTGAGNCATGTTSADTYQQSTAAIACTLQFVMQTF